MTGKVGPPADRENVSTGGSLISDAKLKQLYVSMVQCRLLTERASRLRAPSKGLYSASMGQEAIAAGCTIDLRPEDTIAMTANDSIASLVKGVPLGELIGQLYARASSSADAGSAELAVAAALENKRRKKSSVVVAFAGVAQRKVSSWTEALRFAARRKLPIIFVVNNNPWASLTPPEENDFAQWARSYGLTGISVDGNDVVAVYRVAHESLDRVRQGDGPVLVEGKRYSTSNAQKVSRALRDPLHHMERYLTAKKLFSERWKQKVVADFSKQLDTAVKTAREAKA
jgi:TPP-dependent pyruvate/acetoin dehydrogenase alpha subunit